MTSRTFFRGNNILFLLQFCREFDLIARWRPTHIGQFGLRPQTHIGTAMAFEAPAHAERFLQFHQIHVGYVTVATGAPDTRPKMGAVIEESEIGRIVHSYPADRLRFGPTFSYRQ